MNPQPAERLEKTLARVAKEQGLAQERLRRWVSFLALCGVLERAVSEGVLDNYYLKGGAAMELRFAEGARATSSVQITPEGRLHGLGEPESQTDLAQDGEVGVVFIANLLGLFL